MNEWNVASGRRVPGDPVGAVSRRQFLRPAATGAAALAGAALLGGCGTAAGRLGRGSGSRRTLIRFGYTSVASSPVSKGYEKFAALVRSLSNGEIGVQTFCCNQLGNDLQLVRSAQTGAVQMGASSNNNLDVLTSKMMALELPYLIRDRTVYRRVWQGDPGDMIRAEFERRLGLKVLMVMDAAGFRSIETNGKKIRKPADLRGVKLRAAGTPVELATFRHWGANPVPLPYNQVYTALQQHTVDGEILQPIWFYTDKHVEVAHNICDIRYIMLSHIGVMNLEFFRRLPKAHQDVVLQAARQAEDYEWGIAGKAADDGVAALKRTPGIDYYEPLSVDPGPWLSSVKSVRDRFLDQAGRDLVRQIERMQQP